MRVGWTPVSLSLLGTGVQPVTSLFLGWFGPRGLASILFSLLILEKSEIVHKDELFIAIMATVTMSILAHGISAGPLSRRYVLRTSEMGECAENMPVPEEPFSNSLPSKD